MDYANEVLEAKVQSQVRDEDVLRIPCARARLGVLLRITFGNAGVSTRITCQIHDFGELNHDGEPVDHLEVSTKIKGDLVHIHERGIKRVVWNGVGVVADACTEFDAVIEVIRTG